MTMEYHAIGYIATFTLSLLAVPLAAMAQPAGRIPRLGVLATASAVGDSSALDAFRQGLRDLGYIESKNIAFEYRYAHNKLDRLPALADELVSLKLDMLLVRGPRSALAAKNATRTIPIVFYDVADPVVLGLVDSLARRWQPHGAHYYNGDISWQTAGVAERNYP